MANPLMNIPGLAGYLAQQQGVQQQEMGQLQQFTQVVGLQKALQEQALAKQEAARKNQFRAELGALGPNPTQEQLAGVAAKYTDDPSKLMDVQQKSLDRKDAARERATQFQATLDMRQADLDRKRDEFMQRTQDAAARTQFEQWYKSESLRNQQSRAALDASLKQQGIDLRRDLADMRPMTESQGKAALYGTRAAQSDKVLKALEDNISTTGLALGQATGVVGSALMSSEQQRVNQAQRDFVNAVLRQESGAVISDAEFANAKQQYFPAPGDSKEVLDQKRANRQTAIQGFSRMSGPRGEADIKAILDNPLLPGVSKKPVTPQQNSGGAGYVEIRQTADGRKLGKKADGTIEEIK